MEKRSSPEFLTFQTNYVLLHELRHGIGSVVREAYGVGLIGIELRDKCLNDEYKGVKRTEFFLEAVEANVLYVPEKLEILIKILNKISGLDYIGEKITTSLKDMRTKQSRYAGTTGTIVSSTSATTLPGNSTQMYRDTMIDRFGSLTISGSDVLPFSYCGEKPSAATPSTPIQLMIRSHTPPPNRPPTQSQSGPPSTSLESLTTHANINMKPQSENGSREAHAEKGSHKVGDHPKILSSCEKGEIRDGEKITAIPATATNPGIQTSALLRVESISSAMSSDGGDHSTLCASSEESEHQTDYSEEGKHKETCKKCSVLEKQVNKLKIDKKILSKRLKTRDENIKRLESQLEDEKMARKENESELCRTKGKLTRTASQLRMEKKAKQAALKCSESLLRLAQDYQLSDPEDDSEEHPSMCTAQGLPLAQTTSGSDNMHQEIPIHASETAEAGSKQFVYPRNPMP